MSDDDWDSGFGKSVAVFLNGEGIPDLDLRGERVIDDSFLLCFNAHHEPIEFTLPPKNSAHLGCHNRHCLRQRRTDESGERTENGCHSRGVPSFGSAAEGRLTQMSVTYRAVWVMRTHLPFLYHQGCAASRVADRSVEIPAMVHTLSQPALASSIESP